MRIGILFDHDLTVRHFFESDTFVKLENKEDVIYFFLDTAGNTKPPITQSIEIRRPTQKIKFLSVSRSRMGAWDRLFVASTLNSHLFTGTYWLRFKLFWAIRPIRQMIINCILCTPGIFSLFKYLQIGKLGCEKHLSHSLNKEKLDLIIYPSLMTGYFLNEISFYANKNKIPLWIAMNSWDNPSMKAALLFKPSKLFVWGPQTRSHAKKYLRISDEDLIEAFPAQFEIYLSDYFTDEDVKNFRCELGIEDGEKLILYSGVSKNINETEQLKILDDYIIENNLSCKVLYRPHPWKSELHFGEQDFFAVQWTNVMIDPNMANFYTSQVVNRQSDGFYRADYRQASRVVKSCDGILSPLSTMLLEGLCMGKPVGVINILEDISDKKNAKWIYEIAMRLPHFKEFKGVGIDFCEDKKTLGKLLVKVLRSSEVDGAAIEKSSSKFLNREIVFSDAILHAIDELSI